MNDSPALKLGTPADSAAVNLLNDIIAGLRAGQIDSLAIVTVTPTGNISTMYAGQRRGDMHLGCEMAQTRLLFEIMNPQAQSRIVRPM